jgi:hypothetical protein
MRGRPVLLLASFGLVLFGLTLFVSCDGCADQKKAAPELQKATPHTDESKKVDLQARSAPRGPRFAPLTTGPLSKEDTADCDVEKDLLDKVTCLGALAQRRRDPRFCDRIEALAKAAGDKAPALIRSGSAGSACHRTIAFVRDEPELCVAIQQDSMAAGCLSYFAMKRHDPKVCDLAKGEVAASCYLNEAARTHDASLCAKTGHFADDCNKRLGPGHDEPGTGQKK